jgi:succinyl-CoA synthetase beta subunit
MQLSGLKYGAQLLQLVDFPVPEFLTGAATNGELQRMLDRCGKIVVKPVFHEAVGKKGKAGLVKIVDNLHDALQAKRDLYFATHKNGNRTVQANGVTFEEFVESDLEVYFAISESTEMRKPVLTISPHGGVDIESLDEDKMRSVWIDPFIGIKSFDITNALNDTGCPEQYISPLVQHLPKLWHLYDKYGLSTIELNPVRIKKVGNKYLPVACDLKAGFDQDNPGVKRTGLPLTIFQSDVTPFEAEINRLRTYQGQSDVLEMNPTGTILPFMFGGGANSAATETLGSSAIFASDFGGNPPYEKMYDIARISFKHHLDAANVLLIIGGKANNTDIYITFRGMFDALRDHFAEHGWKPIYTVIGRGGPNLTKGMSYGRDILDSLRLPYKMFGYDTSMILTLEYAKRIDEWWSQSGKDKFVKSLKKQG